MAPKDRPLSPHLQVYRLPLAAILSITHRITGVGLGLGALLLVVWLVAAAAGPDAFGPVSWFLGSWLGLLILFGFAWALLYHLANGIRHLFWDAGYGYDKDDAHRTGIAVLALSVALTVVVFGAGLVVRGAA